MPHITRELLRRRAEHNEGLITTLEELSLHQEEIEAINEVLATTCRKLKILYLQNNIISRMENLYHMKDLEYLNLALNNIVKIEGLGSCEFIKKLDLTVNFIDFDTLEESVDHLRRCGHLRDLYMIGNPCQQKWGDSFTHYVVHRLPQLQMLDGKDINRSMRIIAAQKFPALQEELKRLAEDVRSEKAAKGSETEDKVDGDASGGMAESKGCVPEKEWEAASEERMKGQEELTPHTPEVRTKMYREVAEQKAEKDKRQRDMAPKERDFEKEQTERIAEVRRRETENGDVRQCNEGKYTFHFDEESRPGCVVLDVDVPRHLDSSLIDVDVHPSYVSVVIKTKLLRLRLPAEVKVTDTKAQRSKTTGHLVLIMPKMDPEENAIAIRAALRQRGEDAAAAKTLRKASGVSMSRGSVSRRRETPAASLAEEMMKASQEGECTQSKAVNVRGIVRRPAGQGGEKDAAGTTASFKAVETVYHKAKGCESSRDASSSGSPEAVAAAAMSDHEVPPLM